MKTCLQRKGKIYSELLLGDLFQFWCKKKKKKEVLNNTTSRKIFQEFLRTEELRRGI